jgi:outer membrane protein
MKKAFMPLVALLVVVFFSGNVSYAQQKIGYVNSQDILKLMPERDSAEKAYNKFSDEIQKNFESMNVTYNNMVDTYTKQRDSLSQFIRQSKEAELLDMRNKITNFQDAAQQELQKKQDELLNPILEKVRKAIKAVAEENKFTYILDVSPQTNTTVVYYPEEGGLNILPLVKAKLGLK